MDSEKDIEMTSKPSAGADKDIAQKDSADDRPPTPPKRDFKVKDGYMVAEPQEKRKKITSFQRPEFMYKPENTESCMSCLKNVLVSFNLLIWLFGAALTGVGVWIKLDEDFWDIQTGLDMKQFTNAGYILIAAGVIVMVIGFLGCYGALSLSLCMLIVYAIIVSLIILLEIAVMALVWTAINNKDIEDEIKSKLIKTMQDMAEDEKQQYLLNLMQSKFQCCGIDGADDYGDRGVPPSCKDPATGYPHTQGCLDSVLKYLSSKAAILGGVAVGIFVLQLIALTLTICVACGLRQAPGNGIF